MLRALMITLAVTTAWIGVLPSASADGDTAGSSRAALIGKWRLMGSKAPLIEEFRADGTLTLNANNGSYKWVDDSNIETDVIINNQHAIGHYKIQIDHDSLKMFPPKGGVFRFERLANKP